jgi:hypothetical protein
VIAVLLRHLFLIRVGFQDSAVFTAVTVTTVE